MKKACVLFSGGKDSCLALYKASKNYDIQYLASMIPEISDSFMFHTPDTDLLKKQAEMLGIKLITQKTKGEKDYEIEDLKKLIEKVKDDVQVIVIGGIASNYQGKRINELCSSLGLEVYAPLWDYTPEKLWKELLESGFKVIISKIATEGIPSNFLGKIIDQKIFLDIEKRSKKFKFRLDFEGGDAETTVLYMPMFKEEIRIKYRIRSEGSYRHFLELEK